MLVKANQEPKEVLRRCPIGASVIVRSLVYTGGSWYGVEGGEQVGTVVAPEQVGFTAEQLSPVGCLAVQIAGEQAPAAGSTDTRPRIVPCRDVQLAGVISTEDMEEYLSHATVVGIAHG